MAHLADSYLDGYNKEGSTLTRIPSGNSNKPGNSRAQNYLLKLQTLCKDLTNTMKTNRPKIQELQCQRRFFKRICEKQRQKLDSINISMIRQEYESQLSSLRQKRGQLHQMIESIHEEADEKKQHFIETQTSLTQNRQFLQSSLQSLYDQNRRYRELLQKKMQIVANDKLQIEGNQKLIRDKQKIQEKYRVVREEIRARETKGIKK